MVQSTCIFCNKLGGMTKEHLYGKWANRLVAENGTNLLEVSPAEVMLSVLRGSPKVKRREGHTGQTTIRRVCRSCNGGWMKSLEDSVRPILAPLMQGDSLALDRTRQKNISMWAAKLFMVADFHKEFDARAVSQFDRSQLMNGRLPEGCFIWIGKYEAPNTRKIWCKFESLLIFNGADVGCLTDEQREALIKSKRNTLYGTHARGSVLFHMFYSTHTPSVELHRSGWVFDGAVHMKRIWPFEGSFDWSDLPVIKDEQIPALHDGHVVESRTALCLGWD